MEGARDRSGWEARRQGVAAVATQARIDVDHDGGTVIDLTRAAWRRHGPYLHHDPAVMARCVPLPAWRRACDRAFDLVAATLAFLVAWPVLLVLVGALKLTSRGPVFFHQERVGRYGKHFTCVKLRTMVVGADTHLDDLLATNPELLAEFESKFKLADDPRITRIGRFLRKTSLDELPQLVNVLRGDMSMVGPRPLVPPETARYGDAIGTVLRVRPGLTGVWQVSGRNELSYEERVALDVDYVDSHTAAGDAVVMARTVSVVLGVHSVGC